MQLPFGERGAVVFDVDFPDVQKRRAAKVRRVVELEILNRHRRLGEANRKFSNLRVHAGLGADAMFDVNAENRIERQQQNDDRHDRQKEQPEQPFEQPFHN